VAQRAAAMDAAGEAAADAAAAQQLQALAAGAQDADVDEEDWDRRR